MMVSASPKVIALMQAKAAELQATTRRENSKATLLRCAGGGVVLCALAVVIVACCVGYAKTQEQETKAARAYMAAMKTPVKVTVSGEVGIKDGQQVGLAKGGIVDVSPNSTVGLDPHSTVHAVVTDAPRPSPAQIQADAKPASGAPVLTNFVIFKKAPYGGKGAKCNRVGSLSTRTSKPRQCNGAPMSSARRTGRNKRSRLATTAQGPPCRILRPSPMSICEARLQAASGRPAGRPPLPRLRRACRTRKPRRPPLTSSAPAPRAD
jgi:hypothetical protein